MISAVMTALLASCRRDDFRSESGIIWTTEYHITYNSDRSLADTIQHTLNTVDASLSAFNPASLVSQANGSAVPVAVDSLLARVIIVSQHINGLSGGAFDPTVSPLINLWGFGFREGRAEAPSEAAIDSALRHVGIVRCRIEDGRLYKGDPLMEFNFSAIAKGYACDLVGYALRRNGVEDYMVEIGGEIALCGKSPRGGRWRISIDVPDSTDLSHKSLRAIEPKSPCGIATSGNYRNYREVGSRRVGHTISPITGQPVKTSLLSVTVIAPDCLTADALATACMALEPAEARRMIDAITGVEALFVSDNGRGGLTLSATSGFPALL